MLGLAGFPLPPTAPAGAKNNFHGMVTREEHASLPWGRHWARPEPWNPAWVCPQAQESLTIFEALNC